MNNILHTFARTHLQTHTCSYKANEEGLFKETTNPKRVRERAKINNTTKLQKQQYNAVKQAGQVLVATHFSIYKNYTHFNFICAAYN